MTLLDQEKEAISRPTTENMDAYQAYLRVMAMRDEHTLDMILAAPAFEQAVESDPAFLDGHFQRARIYVIGAWVRTPIMWDQYAPLGMDAAATIRALASGSVQSATGTSVPL